MKQLAITLFIATFFPLIALRGQTYPSNFYITWTGGVGKLFFPETDGQLQLSFPYSTADANGTTIQSVFISKSISPYPKPKLMVSALNLEFGGLRNFVRANIFAYLTTSSKVDFSIGYGRNFYFNILKKGLKKPREKQFVLKPSLSVSFNQYKNPEPKDKNDNYLGSIDNENKTVNLLGYTSGPTYTYTSGHPRTTYTVNTHTTDLYFAQNDLAFFTPKIALTNNQYKHFFHWELNIGYYFPFFEKGGLQIFQNGTNSIKSPGVIGLAERGVTATFNQNIITMTPYKFSSFFVAATVGLSITGRLFHKDWE